MSSSLKLLEQFLLDVIWGLTSKGYLQFVFLLQNQESFWAESWYTAWRTQGLPSCSNGDRKLTFDHFYGRV